MLNFDNIEELALYMFANLDNEDNLVSVITNKKLIIDIMHELLNYDYVILNSCNIDDNSDYNKEYRISLYDDVDSDYWYVNVGKDYDSKNGHYLGSDGYVLFHEDTNSKSFIDKQNNELMTLGEHDWFVVGEDDEKTDYEDEDNVEDINPDIDTNDKDVDSGYSVTVKVIRDINKDTRRELFDMLDMLYRPYPYEYRSLRIFY